MFGRLSDAVCGQQQQLLEIVHIIATVRSVVFEAASVHDFLVKSDSSLVTRHPALRRSNTKALDPIEIVHVNSLFALALTVPAIVACLCCAAPCIHLKVETPTDFTFTVSVSVVVTHAIPSRPIWQPS